MKDIECPYCGKEFNIDWGDYGKEITNEDYFTVFCPHCDKMVLVKPTVSVSFEAEECKCQGENHEWKPTASYPTCFTRMACIHCHEERNPTPEEREKYNIPSIEEYRKSLGI